MKPSKNLIIPEWNKPAIIVPLAQAFPQLGEVKEFKSKQCIFNHDRTQLFDVVSSRYQMVQHRDALDLIQKGLKESFGKVIVPNVLTLNKSSRIHATFKLPIDSVKLNKDDVSEITLLVKNSYDRSCVFSAVLGAFRLICSNGMAVGESFGAVKSRHFSSGQEVENNAGLLFQLQSMIENSRLLKDMWLEWKDTKIAAEEAREWLTGHFPALYLDPILEPKRFPKSKWDLYNDLTYFSTHQTKSANRRIEFDERISKMFYNSDVIEGELV